MVMWDMSWFRIMAGERRIGYLDQLQKGCMKKEFSDGNWVETLKDKVYNDLRPN